jgi:hypothetical protein
MFSESALRLAGVHHGTDLGEFSPAIARVLDEPVAVLEARDHIFVTRHQPRPLQDGYANFEDRRLAAKKRIERKRVTLVGG